MFSTGSLQNLCLFKVVQQLEYYPPELLACLPPTLRRLLLVHLPVIDVCKLTNTCVFDGIDPETIWEQLYNQHIPRYFVSGGEISLPYYVDKTAIEAAHTTFRERYLAILANIIINRARPSGYFQNIDYAKFLFVFPPPALFLTTLPVDIVNTLIAGEKVATVYEKSQQDEAQSAAHKLLPSVVEYSDAPVTALTDYNRKLRGGFTVDYCLYKQANELSQFVPPYHSSYVSETSNHRLRDQDALTLLMEECHYYPSYLSIATHDYRHFGAVLLRKFLGCLVSLKLFVDVGCYETLLTTVMSNPSPMLTSLELDSRSSQVDDDHLSFLAQRCEHSPTLPSFVTPLNMLTKLSISSVASADGLSNLDTVISCQKSLASFSLHSPVSNVQTVACHSFVSALIALVQSPNFESVTLKRVIIQCTALQDLVLAFLTSSCTHPQTLTLQPTKIKGDRNSTTCDATKCLVHVPDSASEYKSLDFSADEYTVSASETQDFTSWLCSLQPLRLKSLRVFCCVDHSQNGFLPLLAENTSFQAKNLSFFLSGDSSMETIPKLLKNVTLRGLEIGFYNGAMDFQQIAEYILNPISTSSSRMEKLEIVELRSYWHAENATPFSKESVCLFSDALFSLPQVNHFTLEISVLYPNQIDPNIVEFIEIFHESWKKNGGQKLKKFVLYTENTPLKLEDNKETILQMMNDIGFHINSTSH